MFDTTTVLTGHIISSHTDLILGYHLACSHLLLGTANSEQCETEMLLRRHSWVSGNHPYACCWEYRPTRCT